MLVQREEGEKSRREEKEVVVGGEERDQGREGGARRGVSFKDGIF